MINEEILRSLLPQDCFLFRVTTVTPSLFPIVRWELQETPVSGSCSLASGTSQTFRGYQRRRMRTHSSILAWEIPGTEESGRLQSTG